MKILMKISLIMIVLLGFNQVISASELTAPKAAGIIGERFDGYLGVVKQADANIKSLIAEVNKKRKSRYKDIAKKRQQPLAKVEAIAGAAAIKKTKKGHYVFLKGKGWLQK